MIKAPPLHFRANRWCLLAKERFTEPLRKRESEREREPRLPVMVFVLRRTLKMARYAFEVYIYI